MLASCDNLHEYLSNSIIVVLVIGLVCYIVWLGNLNLTKQFLYNSLMSFIGYRISYHSQFIFKICLKLDIDR